jgi:hypothetical protein
VGVQRQWCGRLGKIDNCQVALYLGYASRTEHALVDCRLYLPKEWATDGERRAEAGVPKTVRFRTRHELAWQLLEEHGAVLPHAWVAGDDEMGRCGWFRRQLRQQGEPYLLAVPSNTSVRDLAAADPPYPGHGRRSRVPFRRVDRWCAALPAEAWQTIEVRDGEKGPLVVQLARTLVQARSDGKASDEAELLVASSRAARGRQLEARLPAGERTAGDAVGGTGPGLQGGTSDRGEPTARQERGWAGRLPGADLGGLASPPSVGVGGDVVPDSGNTAGKKNTRRR